MRKYLFLAFLFSPIFLFAQNSGIAFQRGLSWAEILQKAQKENKYIFVDCYASWCGPCKWMDKVVYPNDSLGEFVNQKFISVKIQMDSTGQDNKEMQSFYETAHFLEKEYSINAYPCFLFFSPQGLIVHKEVGAKDVAAFSNIAKDALSYKNQYYSLLNEYKGGHLEYYKMGILADEAMDLGQDSVAKLLASDYIEHYLSGLPLEQLWTTENLTFIKRYSKAVKSDGKLIKLYFRDRIQIDSVMHVAGYANGLINHVIYVSEVSPYISAGIARHFEPNWKKIAKSIRTQYGLAYANGNLLKGRLAYYKSAEIWHSYAKYLVIKMDKIGIMNISSSDNHAFYINNVAYEIFCYSDKRSELKKALTWINIAISMNSSFPEGIDTKANILYRLGKKDEAITLEQKSVSMAPHNREIQVNFEKMKEGSPTWMAVN